jgi:hypothetical protein
MMASPVSENKISKRYQFFNIEMRHHAMTIFRQQYSLQTMDNDALPKWLQENAGSSGRRNFLPIGS